MFYIVGWVESLLVLTIIQLSSGHGHVLLVKLCRCRCRCRFRCCCPCISHKRLYWSAGVNTVSNSNKNNRRINTVSFVNDPALNTLSTIFHSPFAAFSLPFPLAPPISHSLYRWTRLSPRVICWFCFWLMHRFRLWFRLVWFGSVWFGLGFGYGFLYTACVGSSHCPVAGWIPILRLFSALMGRKCDLASV